MSKIERSQRREIAYLRRELDDQKATMTVVLLLGMAVGFLLGALSVFGLTGHA